jgi:hypothetical protein
MRNSIRSPRILELDGSNSPRVEAPQAGLALSCGGFLHAALGTITHMPPALLQAVLVVSVTLNLLLLRRLLGHARGDDKGRGLTRAGSGTAMMLESATARRQRLGSRAPPPPTIGSLTAAVDKLRQLRERRKYIEAGSLLDVLRASLRKVSGDDQTGDSSVAPKASSSSSSSSWSSALASSLWGADEARAKLASLLEDGELERRIETCRASVRDLNSDDGFDLVREDEHKRVLQRIHNEEEGGPGGSSGAKGSGGRGSGNGKSRRMLTVKVEAELEGVRPSDCMLIWREAELYPHWFPFVSGGKMLGELHPSEAVLQLFVDTSFMNVDIPLWGFACDNISVDSSLLLCVRPVDGDTKLPTGVAPPDPTTGRSIKLLGSWRALAYIDILVEPTGPRSVRIAFRMMGELPSYAPSWTFNHIVQDGMCNIFREMSKVATRMAADDPECAHTKHVTRSSYSKVKRWFEDAIRFSGAM